MLLSLTSLFYAAVTLVVAPGSSDQDQSFQRFLSGLAQKEARELAKKTKLPINQGGFKGQLEAPYPEKIQVEVLSFQFKNDTISASVSAQCDCLISGTWTREGESINIKALVSLKLSVTGFVRVEKQKTDFYLAPTLTDCDFQILKLSIQEPVELVDGESLLTEMANTAFQRNKAAIISQINQSLTKHQLKL